LSETTPVLKDAWELEIMREAGRIAAVALRAAASKAAPGASTFELDRAAHETIVSMGATPTFIGYGPGGKPPYPAATCISVNEEIVHGIPSRTRELHEGDIVSIDIGATYKGYVGDCAMTVGVGAIAENARRIVEATREALEAAIRVMVAGARVTDIGRTVQAYAEERGYGVVREYCGHGVGRRLHEAPQVPNYFEEKFRRHDVVLRPGLVLAVEPMLCEGTWKTRELSDGWTVVTADGKLSAHWEHTIAVTKDGPVIYTLP
jgi:methionyl aminopeptidase